MLRALFELIEKHAGGDLAGAPAHVHRALEVAAAALLVEIARADGAMQPAEHAAVLAAIHERFALTDADAEDLVDFAEGELKKAEGYFPFTSLINQNFSQEQKEHLVELMWRAAYADKDLTANELHLMRKIAGLLYVSDDAYILAKLRAKQDASAA
ncbi:MAG TPA: TerB family tellurite resistance protein [Burkholderiaceae bacterium]|nr:TerB family tellurite resistance protein [Burkholderiaceae bacterium]